VYQEDQRTPRRGDYDAVAVGLFAVAGAILALAGVSTYIGLTVLNVLGVEWAWIWE
jgi:hypothetical protein